MDDVTMEAVRVLAKHSVKTGIRDGKVHCQCGWDAARGRAPGFYTPHQLHQVEELALAGLLLKRRRPSPSPRSVGP